MELYSKFRKYFGLTLVFAVILSMILAILITNFSFHYLGNETIKEKIIEQQKNMKIPLIETVRNTLFKKFQQTIYTLETISDYYDLNINKNKNFNETFIKERMINSVIANQQFPDFFKQIMGPNNSTYLDYGLWHIDNVTPNITYYENHNTKQKSQILLNQLTTIAKITKIFRSFYDVFENNNQFNCYIASNKTNLFYYYPIAYSTKKNKNDYYMNYSNSYYDFHTRPWYKDSVNLKNDASEWVFFTNPYSFTSDLPGLTLCYRMKDNSDEVEDFLYICSDLSIADLTKTFDDLNRNTDGYFYVIPINSSTPMYYPGMNVEKKEFLEIERYEYSKNTPYYVDEALSFELNTISEMNIENKNLSNITEFPNNMTTQGGFYTINENKKTFSVYPIKLFIDPNKPHTSVHVLSIIYVSSEINSQNLRTFKNNLDFPKFFVMIIILTIVSLVLIISIIFFVVNVGKNIVKPIKSLKNLIHGMSSNDKSKTEIQKSKKDELEEDYFEFRSQEIDNLFNLLLKLKNVLSFTSSSQNNQNPEDLINYVSSKYSFNDVSNMRGKSLCDSNIGILSNKFEKYDKAIFHLLEAVQNNEDITEEISKKNFNYSSLAFEEVVIPEEEISIVEDESKISSFHTEKAELIEKNEGKQNDVYLEKRYPQLIFAFHQFFKLANQLEKLENSEELHEKTDIFVMKDYHSLKNFENTLKSYLNLSFFKKDIRRTAEALLLYNHFLIDFKIKQFNLFSSKKQDSLLKTITSNFEHVDLLLTRIEKNDNPEFMKTYLNNILDDTYLDENNKIPYLILKQKANYLKGKFCLNCHQKEEAIQFFLKSRETSSICDFKIIQKSNKKLIKIIDMFIDLLKGEILRKSINIEKMNTQMVQKRNLKISEYLELSESLKEVKTDLGREFGKMKINSRNLGILIDFTSDKDEILSMKALESIQNIMDSYLNEDDRVCLFLSPDSVPLISLTGKNINNHSYLQYELNRFRLKLVENDLQNKSTFVDGLINLKNYLLSKSKSGNDNFIIAFTEVNMNKEEKEKFVESVNDIRKSSGDCMSIILVGLGVNKDSSEFYHEVLNYGSSAFISIDNIRFLKNVFRNIGNVRNELIFSNEKY